MRTAIIGASSGKRAAAYSLLFFPAKRVTQMLTS